MSCLWQHLDEYPPYYVRLWAKSGPNTALSDAEIAIGSGIEINRIRQIKIMTDWRAVTIGEAMRYTLACNFDPTNGATRRLARNYDYRCRVTNNTRPYRWLRRSPKFESEILPVLAILREKLIKSSSAA